LLSNSCAKSPKRRRTVYTLRFLRKGNTDRLRQLMIPIVKSKDAYIKTFVFLSVLAVLLVEFSATEHRVPDRQGIDEAVALLSSKILLTRQKARASNTRYRIHCDYRESVCRVYRQDGRGRWIPDAPDDIWTFPKDVSVSPSSKPANGFIEIDETGAIINGDGPVSLKLTDQNGTLKSIRISSSGIVQECSNW
jgi:hypothetical protein